MYQNIKPSEPHITARAKTAHLKPLNNPLFCYYVFCNYEIETLCRVDVIIWAGEETPK